MLLEGTDLQRRSRHIDIKNQGELVERTFVERNFADWTCSRNWQYRRPFYQVFTNDESIGVYDVLGFSSFEGALVDCLLGFGVQPTSTWTGIVDGS